MEFIWNFELWILEFSARNGCPQPFFHCLRIIWLNGILLQDTPVDICYTLPVYKLHVAQYMNKMALVELLAEKHGVTKADAERMVDTLIDAIIGALKSGDEVSIAGLGIFSAKMRAARTARNPRTGESIQVPAMRVPKFRAAKALKDAVK